MQAMRSFIRAATIIATMSLSMPAHAEPVVLRIGNPLVGPDHASSKAVEIFRTELTRRTQGGLDVEFPVVMGGGSIKELVDGVHTGSLFALPCSIAYLSRLVPEIDALGLPFVFRDANHARRAVEGPAGKLFEAKLNAKGFVPLGWMALGVRQVTNAKRPLKTLEDFKGLRIRVQPSETHMATFRALGANPVAMDFSNVYTALRQGDIDGEETPYTPTYAAKLYEVEKYISDSGHIFDFIVFIANKNAFTAFQPEKQQAIRDAARIAVVEEWKMAAAVDAASLESLQANGMQFDPIPDATRVALKKAMSGVIEAMRKRVGAELVDEIVAGARR
jgi:TRAP-type transport system periplasmic protein